MLAAVVLALPDPARGVLWEVVPLAAVTALAIGIRRHRPPAAAGWWLVTAGVAAWTGADLLWTAWYVAAGGDAAALPLWLDLLYIPMYPLLAAGLYRLSRLSAPSGEGEGEGVTLDAVVVVVGLALLQWTMIFQAFSGGEDLRSAEHIMTLICMTLDLVVAFAAVRLWLRYGVRNTSYRMLGLGVAALIAGDAVFTATLVGDGNPGMAVLHGPGAELLGTGAWMLWLVLMGTAALHPSMAESGRSASGTALTFTRGGLFLAVACAGPVSFVLSLDSEQVTLNRFDIAFPMLLLTGLSVFLLIRMLAATGTAQRHARRLDEQAAELSRALEEQNALQQLLSHRSMHDPLTGLSNRALFTDRLEQATARRSPTARHALLLLDLDGFKHVNDSYGHPVGDQLLIQAGRRLRTVVRESDTLARFGGDEFAILLEDVTSEEAGEVAGRVVEAIAESFTVSGEVLHLTVSVGLHMIAEAMEAQEALRDADLALYAAKAAGKNQISV
ncbi:diguanylate cyclase domain-containing protein, partial [Planomonospora corallina]